MKGRGRPGRFAPEIVRAWSVDGQRRHLVFLRILNNEAKANVVASDVFQVICWTAMKSTGLLTLSRQVLTYLVANMDILEALVAVLDKRDEDRTEKDELNKKGGGLQVQGVGAPTKAERGCSGDGYGGNRGGAACRAFWPARLGDFDTGERPRHHWR